jgi:hypothetical protein
VLHQDPASRSRRARRQCQRQARKRAAFQAQILSLEERCLLSKYVVPVPDNPIAKGGLPEIFWNGGPPINPDSKFGSKPSPAAKGAMKTITLTNYSANTIFPFMRSENIGKDPNDSRDGYYDPQDLHGGEFREYLGYSDSTGAKFLGLPSGATMKFQVPLVLWDGNNTILATDGTYLTGPDANGNGATVFNYDDKAKIFIVPASQVGETWVQSSANYPTGLSPLIMFYYGDTAHTVPNDAPAQLGELTFRDPYLGSSNQGVGFIDDSFQSFPEINYDLSYVNTLVAPAAMESSVVPITSGAVESNNLHYYLPNNKDFGWHGTDQGTATFDPRITDFVKNQGMASVGQYFGGKGWPQYYTPVKDQYIIPSGANIFDDSPLNAYGPNRVHTSNYDGNRWLLSSSGGGAITASWGGVVLTDKEKFATELPLAPFPDQKSIDKFDGDIQSMEASGQKINLTISTSDKNYQGVLGTVMHYDPSASVNSYNKVSGGSGYSQQTYVKIVGGGGSGAMGDVHVVDGVVDSIGLNPANAGSGYTSIPKVEIIDPTGSGKGADYVATITGGKVIVTLAEGKSLPTNVGISYVFTRIATDYAAKAITDLWYSWANFYYEQHQNDPTQTAQGTMVHKSIKDPGPKYLTNEITLVKLPKSPLAVGMTVTDEKGLLPKGTTILKLDGKTVYLSQIPKSDPGGMQTYTFSAPKKLAIDDLSANYTHPYELKFSDADKVNARLFGGSVYEAMAVEDLDLPKPKTPTLPRTMFVVDNVIKFYANIPSHERNWGTILVGEVRDDVKSILRGVFDYYKVPDQSLWYPDPVTKTGGQQFNVYNLDPYVRFVHIVEKLSAYGFSVDDDVANPSATGPRDDNTNHLPKDLQIGFGGIQGTGALSNATKFTNQNEWFPVTKWGQLTTTATTTVTATIGVQQTGQYKGYSVITLTGKDPLRQLNQIITPGPGQVGAYISAPGYIVPGTTLIFFPNGVTNPQIILSQRAISTTTSIPVTINAGEFTATKKIPRIALKNASFTTPPQTTAPYFTIAPTGPNVGWNFTGTAGIADQRSKYSRNNPQDSGTQTGFIQNTGSISQTVTLAANQAYALSFLVAQRRRDDGTTIDKQTLQVRVDNQVINVGDSFQPAPTADGSYVLYTSKAFKFATAGSHVITIEGTNKNGGNNTALIDQVQLTGVVPVTKAHR